MVFDILSNCEVCFIRLSEAKPHLTLQRISLSEAKLQFSVNRLAN